MNPSLCNIWRCTLNMRTVKKSAVDPSGMTCDKIGLTMRRWANQEEVCSTRPGTCLKNQMKWYLEQEKDDVIKRDLSLPAIKEPNKTTLDDPNRIHTLTYIHSNDDVTRLKIDTFDATVTEIISDFPGFIVSAKIDGECEVSSSKKCNMELDVKNMGKFIRFNNILGVKKSDYTIRATCFDDPIRRNPVATISETVISIDANKNKTTSIPIKLTGSVSTQKGYCDIILLSGKKDTLDSVKIDIKVKVKEKPIGADPQHRAQNVVGERNPQHKITIQPTQQHDGKDSTTKKTDKKDDEPKCRCASWNIFCMLINFNLCISSYVSKVLFYVLIALGILLLLILLPVLIPLFVTVFKGIAVLVKMPFEAIEQKRRNKRMLDNTNMTLDDF
ncbi:uncharacterized protein TA09120 [Theileria annulata]|uniref:Generative cell specific-1/HAP2 domain-containing protein n=1 Tax=Theileria annulata TaxID=5874 RepID=Q4U9A3_THEAN|nr:uncharacterized protein TA09120 [Theileria annulata]CAI76600.1 hypothetical protein, conserved [Theileria annulata]|eukprot:XP_953225.1 hypothetical protein, conserved [Theileria annulata]